MLKLSVAVLVLFACFALVSQARLPSHAQERHLEELKRFVSDPGYPTNFGVKANFGEKFNTTNSIGEKTTYVNVLISTSCSGFLKYSSSYFESFDCDSQWCTKDSTTYSSRNYFKYPFIYANYGYNSTISSFSVPATDGSEPWKLTSTAFYSETTPSYYNTPYFSYYRNNSNPKSWGWIGLGIEGESMKNFQTEEPIFSVNVTGVGVGQIIFGKDTSLFKADRTPQIIPCDGNWTLNAQNMSLGPYINQTSHFTPKIIFDMNYEFIGVQSAYYNYGTYSSLLTEFRTRYMKHNSSITYQDASELIQYSYHGELHALPPLTFGLSNNYNLTIPPEVYMKPIPGFPGHYTTILRQISSTSGEEWVVLGSSYLSQYYTIFNKPKDGQPQVTLYPIYTPATASSSSNTLLYIIIGAAVAVVVLVIVLKGKGASAGVNLDKKPSTGLELR